MKNNNLRSGTVLTLITVFALIFLQSNFVYAYHGSALPQGGSVVNGNVSINYAGHHTLDVTASNNSIINWNSFNIGSKSTVDFIQPNSSSVVLNRVVGIDPSSIYGTLEANGRVFIVNPNGIFFGPNSQVNVYALTASTLDISNSDFLAGNYTFTGNGKNAYIINKGNIHVTNGGYVALLSQSINNSGVIEAQLGHVVLATGQTIAVVGLDDDNTISVDITGAVNNGVFGPDGAQITQAAIQNSGTIEADGGTILLNAKILNGIFDNAINNSGVIQANSLVNNNGDIEIVANGGNAVLSTGSVTSANGGVNGNGGNISIDSTNDISVESGATLDISGGSQAGNGGDLDIVTPGTLNFAGTINGAAAEGYALGTADLDPNQSTISGSFGTNTTIWNQTGVTITAAVTITGGATLNIFADHVGSGANNWNNGSGDIDDSGDYTISGGGTGVLDLEAGTGIGTANDPILVKGLASVSATMDPNGNGSNGIYISNSGATALTVTAASTNNGDINLASTGSGAIDLSGDINAGTGNIILDAASGGITQNSGKLTAGGLVLTGAGNDTLTDTNNAVTKIAADINGSLSYNDTNALTVATVAGTSGINTSSNPLSLTTTGGSLTINQAINVGTASGDTITLSATGGITQNNSGVLTANGLLLEGTGPDVLNNANNAVRKIAADITGSLSYTDINALNVSTIGSVSGITTTGASNNVTLNTGNALTLSQDISAASGTVTLDPSAGGVTATAGGVIAGNLVLEGVGAFNLSDTTDNHVSSSITATGISGGDLTYEQTLGGKLTIDGITDTGHNVTLEAVSLAIGGAINAGTGNVGLTATTGNIEDASSSTITGGIVTLDAATGVGDINEIDTSANQIDVNVTGSGKAIGLADFGGGAVLLDDLTTNNGNITVGADGNIDLGTVNAGTASVDLAAGNLGVTGIIDDLTGHSSVTGGTTVTLDSLTGIGVTNPINTAAGSIVATVGDSSDPINIKQTGNVTLTTVTTDSGTIDVTGSGTLTTDDISSDGLGANITLSAVGGISITQSIDAGTGILTLDNATTGTITQSGGILTAGTLDVTNTVGSTTLNEDNLIPVLGSINAAGETFSFTDDVPALTQSGALIAATANITNIGGTITLNNPGNEIGSIGEINEPGQVFTLVDNVPGGLTQSGAWIVGTLDLTNTASGTTLTYAGNEINELGTIDAAGQAFSLIDNVTPAGTLAQSGPLTAASLNLTNNTGGIDLSTQANAIGQLGTIDANGGLSDFLLNNTISLGETLTGSITADGLTLEGDGTFTLENTTNSVNTLTANITGGGLTYDNAGTLVLTTNGVITNGGAITISSGGTLTANDVDSTNGGFSSGATIDLTAADDLYAGTVDAGTAGNVFLTSNTGDILDIGSPVTTLISGNQILLDSLTGSIGAAAPSLEIDPNAVDVNEGVVSLILKAPGGNIYVNTNGSFATDNLSLINIDSTGTMVFGANGGSLNINSGIFDSISLSDLYLEATGGLTVNDAIQITPGSGNPELGLYAKGNIVLANNLTAHGGDIQIDATFAGAGTSGSITTNGTQSIDTTDLLLAAAKGINITTNTSANSNTDISANNTGSGNININNTGNWTIFNLTTLSDLSFADGLVDASTSGTDDLTAHSTITVDAPVSTGGANLDWTATDIYLNDGIDVPLVNTGTGSQTYNDPVILDADATLTGTGISFDSTLDGGFNLTINDSGTTTFAKAVGTTPLESLKVTSTTGIDINGGSVTTVNGQKYTGPVSLGANTTLTAGTPGVDFNTNVSTINGAYTLKITGNAEFDGVVGANSSPTGLTVTGSTDINTSGITTAGPQNYDGAVTVSIDTALNTTGIAATADGITFGGSVDSSDVATPIPSDYNTLSIDDSGITTFKSTVGTNAALGELSVTAGTIDLNGSTIDTAKGGTADGEQNYNSPVVLTTDVSLNTTGIAATADGITFGSSVDSSDVSTPVPSDYNTLSIDDSGITTFKSTVGTNAALGELSVTAGTIDLNGSTIDTAKGNGANGEQNYNSPVVLTTDVSLNTTGIAATADGITFGSSVDSSDVSTPVPSDYNTLSIDDSGITTFKSTVGTNAALGELTVSAGTIDLNGSTIDTAKGNGANGEQNYNSPVVLTTDVSLNTTGIASTADGITFGSSVDSSDVSTPVPSDYNTLSIDDSGITTFKSTVGTNAALGELTVSAGTIDLNGSTIDTAKGNGANGEQNYNSPVVLTTDVSLNTTGIASTADGITFGSSVDSSDVATPIPSDYNTLSIDDSGITTFQNNVGVNEALGELTVTSNAIDLNGSTIDTAKGNGANGEQNYNSPVVLTTDVSLNTTGIAATADGITFGSSVDSSDVSTPVPSDYNTLSIDDSGITTFKSTVGTNAALGELSVTAGTIDLNGSTIDTAKGGTADGEQNYNSPVVLLSNTSLNTKSITSGDGITFDSTVDSSTTTSGLPPVTTDNDDTLTINDSGITTFEKNVGVNEALGELNVKASTIDLNGGTIDTAKGNGANGEQIYQSPVVLTKNASLNTTGITSGNGIDLESSVNSTANQFYTLTIDDSGETVFGGAVGTGTNQALGEVTVTAPTIDINGGAVTTNASTTVPTNGEQNYNGSVILSANATLTTTGITSGDGITFNGTVDSATNTGRSLTISDSGETTFMDAVGATHKLSSLTANATASGTTDINGGSVTTTGAQTYHNPVVLSADAVLNGKNISFDSTISGDQNLTINDTGTTTFVGNVGWPGATPALTPLVNLVVNANTIAAINSVIDATGTVVLNVTGTGGVTEGANGYIIAPNLLLNGGGVLGSFTLANANNDVNTIAANIGGSLTFENSTNLTVGTVDLLPITTASAVNGITSTLGNVTLTTLDTTGTGLITLNQNVAAGPVDNVTLNSAGGVTQTFGSVTGLGLQLLGNGTFTLNDAGNDVTDIAANVDGSITYNNSALLIVYKVPLLGAGTSNITTDNGNVTLNTEGLLTIIGNITAGTGTVVLNSTGGVVEAGGNVTASNLLLLGNGTFSLLTSSNQVGTLAASIIGPLYYTNSGILTVGTVTGSTDGGVTTTTENGITVGNNAVDINTGGELTLGDSVVTDGGIDAGTAVITLNTKAGGINQIGGDLISKGLLLLSNGATSAVTDSITDPDGGNAVGTIAANINGSLSYTDSAALTVGTVKGTINGLTNTTVSGITTDNNNVVLATELATGGALTINEPISAGTGTITLDPGNNGGATQGTLGVLTSDGLLLLGSGSFVLDNANNINGTIAADINGTLSYTDAGTLTVGTVVGSSTVNGITSTNNDVTLTAADDLNLGTINAGTGDVTLNATTGSILDDGALNPSSVNGNTVNLNAAENIGAGTGDVSTDPLVTNSNFLNVDSTDGNVYLNSTGVEIENFSALNGSATLLTNDVILDTVTVLDDFTLEATSGNITIDGTTESLTGAVNLDADHGNINAGPGSLVEANANSFFSTPNGTIGVQSGPVNVDIIGNLILNIGTRIGLTSGILTGTVDAPPANIPLVLPSNFPDPLYPPGNVFFNGIRIWPSESEFELSQANSGLLNHFVFPSAQSLALTQVNTFDPSTSSTQSGGSGLFLYHPLTDVDSGSFDQEFQLDEGAYDFIDGDILKKGAH